MTKSQNGWTRLIAVAISIILALVMLPSSTAYADSNITEPYAAATCGQCDKGTIFSGTKYEEGYQRIPCQHEMKYGYDYRIITYRVTYNKCSNCSFYQVTGMEQVSATGYFCAGSMTPALVSPILNLTVPSDQSAITSCAHVSNNEMPDYIATAIQETKTYFEQNSSSVVPYAMVCPGCNAAPAIQHYVTDETVIYVTCVHQQTDTGAYDAWITPVTMYVTDCGGSCGFRSVHSVETGTGYMICLA